VDLVIYMPQIFAAPKAKVVVANDNDFPSMLDIVQATGFGM